MSYKITRQYGRGPETTVQTCANEAEATTLINKFLTDDAAMGSKATYRLYDALDEVKKEFLPGAPISAAKTEATEKSGPAASSSPTPFSNAPRPPGSMPRWTSYDEDEKKK